MVITEPNISLNHGDCLEEMRNMESGQYDLAIVDPPYFSGPEKRKFYGQRVSSRGVGRVNYTPLEENWQLPNGEYFQELRRVSKHQIIWGINYFDFKPNPGRIIWDKVNDKSSFSDCEIASCSLIDTVRIFRFMWNGMMQGKSATEGHIMQGNKRMNEKRIHPTQKPVILYKWTLQTFAKPGWKILDTHRGSASIAIACWDLGFDLDAWEISEYYHAKSLERFKKHTAQKTLFKHGAIGLEK